MLCFPETERYCRKNMQRYRGVDCVAEFGEGVWGGVVGRGGEGWGGGCAERDRDQLYYSRAAVQTVGRGPG